MHCREICSKYSVKRPFLKEIGRYADGQKRCSSCSIYMKWNGIHCPCCGHFLRTRPRNTSGKNKLSYNGIFKKFQLELKLNRETINYSKKLYNELLQKDSLKHFSPHLIIGICIFIASRFTGQQKLLKTISEVFDTKEIALELCCEITLDEIKPTLINN